MSPRNQRLLLPDKASTYATIVAAVDHGPFPSGAWLVTLCVEGEGTKHCEAIFGPDGQYMETGPGGALECLGFGTWQHTGQGSFEVTCQRPIFEGAECTGWTQTVFRGKFNAASCEGSGQRTTFNVNGDEQGTVPVAIRAERRDTFAEAAPC